MKQLSVIVPTFREAENLAVLVPRLQQVFTDASIDGEVIVVDDNSPDATIDVVQRLSQTSPVRLIVRQSERGLSSAVIAGMRAAEGDVLLCMDADLSHPPEGVPRLFRQVAATPNGRSSDFVIGSRYVSGGSTEAGWGLGRWLNSKVATWLAWPLASVSDPMAGFFALPREAFLRVTDHLDPIGYKIGLELLVKTAASTVTEVPIEFRNRLHGESKLSLREQLNYLRHLARLYRFRFPRLTRFLSFGLVGSSGAAVDLLAFLLLLKSGLSPLPAAVFAIWAAMTSNFELNRRL
ncbi:MAG: dolichyl-phosphate beta-D-mannosyltransferase, partial [Planctomycetota bacterium]